MPKRRAEIEADPSSQLPYSPMNCERIKRLKTAPSRPAYSSLLGQTLDSSSLSWPTEDRQSSHSSEAQTPVIRPQPPPTSPDSSFTATTHSHISDPKPENHSIVTEIVELGIDLSALDLAGCENADRSAPRRHRRLRWSSSSSSRPPLYQYRQHSESVFIIDDDFDQYSSNDRDAEVEDDPELFIGGALRMDWTTPSRSSSSRNRRFASISLKSPNPGSYEHSESRCNSPYVPYHRSTHWHSDPLAPSDLLLDSRYISHSQVLDPPKCPKALRTSLDDPPPDSSVSDLPYSLSSRKNKKNLTPSPMRVPTRSVTRLELHRRVDQEDLMQATPMRMKSDTLWNQFMRFKRPHDHWSPTPSNSSPPSYTASMRGDYKMQ